MTYFSPTDLIINPDGSAYHLHIKPEQIPDHIILVGDPDRVPIVSQFFDKIDLKIQKREFQSHFGKLNGMDIGVISSGIGADNVEIVMTELDALVNIDFQTRLEKKIKRSLNLIRIGTSGSIQTEIPVDSIVVSKSAIGFDNLGQFYAFNSEQQMNQDALKQWASDISYPQALYGAHGSNELFAKFMSSIPNAFEGLTVTAPGFYAPQGRSIRMNSRLPHLLDDLSKTPFQGKKITNIEMETAAYYSFAASMGHQMISLNAILANRLTHEFSKDPEKQMMNLISFTINSFSSHNQS